MPVTYLQPGDYDARYFEGDLQDYTHNAGYSEYHVLGYRHRIKSAKHVGTIENSTGWVFGDLLKGINLNGRFVGKSVLVLGCAYGFEVAALRDLGIEADGIDDSQYAIDQADSTKADFPLDTANDSIKQYLRVENAVTSLASYGRNQYDFIYSRWFLDLLSDVDLTTLITEMNRVSRSQLHIVNPNLPIDKYWNVKSLTEWSNLSFEKGTLLIANNDINRWIKV